MDIPIGDKGTSCPYIDLMEGRDENPGFMKTHMQELLEEKMYEIREIFNQYLNDEEEKYLIHEQNYSGSLHFVVWTCNGSRFIP